MNSQEETPRGEKRNAGFSRSIHRARSHDSAHAADVVPPPPAAERPRHALIPHGEASVITTAVELDELLAHLRAAGRFAYDSEFIGELTYVPKLCLIQVACAQRVALIDPLVPGLDVRPFWELVADPGMEKIVHAGEQDLEPVIRHLNGRAPANIFDKQVAAGFVGMAYPVALSKLVHEMTGARLGKGLTFTHWDQRPLSGMQLRYAADDVRYLVAVREKLGERLAALGHEAWARDEFATMCDPAQFGFNPEEYFRRVRGATSLTPQQASILRELTVWRDTGAREHDVPPRSFVRDEVLIDLARSPVKSVEKLSRVRGLPRPVEAAQGARIVEATQRALALPPERWPNLREPERSPTERFNADALWAAAQCLCAGLGIDPALAASRQDITELYRWLASAPGTPEPDSSVLKGWRREALGEPLIALVRNGGKLAFEWSQGSIRTIRN